VPKVSGSERISILPTHANKIFAMDGFSGRVGSILQGLGKYIGVNKFQQAMRDCGIIKVYADEFARRYIEDTNLMKRFYSGIGQLELAENLAASFGGEQVRCVVVTEKLKKAGSGQFSEQVYLCFSGNKKVWPLLDELSPAIKQPETKLKEVILPSGNKVELVEIEGGLMARVHHEWNPEPKEHKLSSSDPAEWNALSLSDFGSREDLAMIRTAKEDVRESLADRDLREIIFDEIIDAKNMEHRRLCALTVLFEMVNEGKSRDLDNIGGVRLAARAMLTRLYKYAKENNDQLLIDAFEFMLPLTIKADILPQLKILLQS